VVEHMNQWQGAYLDNELNGEMQRKVEAHLANCSYCKAELEELKSLSKLLKTAAKGKSLVPDVHFSAQVALKLPRHQIPPLASSATRIGWWLLPAGILGVWAFIQAVQVASSLALAAGQFGLVSGPLAWLSGLNGQNLFTSAVLSLVDGRFGLTTSSFLAFIGRGTGILWNLFILVLFQAGLALLFASWLAVWLLRNFPKKE